VIDYVREACERLREQLPAGRQALTEKKQVLTDVKARLARYHERFERAANAGEEDLAWGGAISGPSSVFPHRRALLPASQRLAAC